MDFYTIVGIQPTSFPSRDDPKTLIEGVNIYVTSPLDIRKPGAKGLKAEKLFLTNTKISELSFSVNTDQVVEIYYNKYGKVSSLRLVEEKEIDFS